MRTVLRVLGGFIVAWLAAGLTTLLFVFTPDEVLSWLTALPANERGERFSIFGLLWLAAVTQTALFSVAFAVLAAVIGEIRKVRAWTYYAIAGIVIAALGFSAQWLSEPSGQSWSVVNSHYPLVAFLTTGFVAGFVYWMVAGRHAGGARAAAEPPPPLVRDSAKEPAAEKPKDSAPDKPAATTSTASAASKPASDAPTDSMPEATSKA